MSEKLNENSGNSPVKAKEDFQKILENAISDGKLTKEEISDIINRYEQDKKRVIDVTKTDLVIAIKDIQTAIWVSPDWKIWPKTIKALKACNNIDNIQWVKKQEQPKKEKEEPKKVEPVLKKIEEKKEILVKRVSLDDVKKSISDIKIILKNWIQSGEEEDLTNIIKELQDKKVLKSIPWIKNWKLEKWKDLISIWEDVISRLKKVEKKHEKDSDKKKEQEEKLAKEKAKKEQEDLDLKNSKEKSEKEKFTSDLASLDITSLVSNLNTAIDSKNNLPKPDNLEDEVDYEWQKAELKSKLDKIKLSSDNKTFSDLTSNSKIEKDDKWNLTLKFNLDPKGFDKFDSSKTYTVQLSSTKLEDQKNVILQTVEKAYSEQISDLTK